MPNLPIGALAVVTGSFVALLDLVFEQMMKTRSIVLDEGNNIIFGTELAVGSPNGPLYFGGYAVTSPQAVDIKLSDLSGGATPVAVAIIVEGDVTNTDTKSHTASNAVNGIIKLFGCEKS